MLENVPLFSCLSDAHLGEVSRKAVVRQFPGKTVLFSDGDQSDSLYIVRSGRVKVYLSNDSGKEIFLNSHGPGEYFGEMALLDSEPRSANVATTEDSEFVTLSRADFESVLDRYPEMPRELLRGLSARLRNLTENVRSLALMDVHGRVARMLMTLARNEDGILVVRERLTQQDMANRVGASREMVSKVLGTFTEENRISTEHGVIYIHEPLLPALD